MIPGNINTDLISGAEGAYQVERSLRFNSADSAYLSRTPASAGNRKTWTWSGWVKRSALGGTQVFFGSWTDSSNTMGLMFNTSNQLFWDSYSSGSLQGSQTTSAVFRDTSAWYHIVWAVDTTNATAANRSRIYVNGTEAAYAGATNPSQNADLIVNRAASHTIGNTSASAGNYFSGYLANVEFVDGAALTPASFGETNATTGQWVPKAYTGSYGTNGFRLDFSDNSAATATTLGKDRAGSNNWTPNNFAINNSTLNYSSYWAAGGNNNAAIGANNAFDGNTSTYLRTNNSGNYQIWTPANSIAYTSLRIYVHNIVGTAANTLFVNGVAQTTPTSTGWFTPSGVSSPLTSIEIRETSTTALGIAAVEINNGILLDRSWPGNDSLVDTPTSYGTDTGAGGDVRGNYCTWNPLNIAGGALANGNLDLTNTAGGRKASTFAVSSGKWYWEVTVTSAGDAMIGTMLAANPVSTGSGNFVGGAANEYGYYQSAFKYTNASATSYGATFGNGDVIGVALDLDAGTLVYYKNGVSQGTAFTGITGTYTPAVSAGGSSGASMTANFGQRPFAFPVSGFKALCDTNLPAPTIARPSTVMDVVTYTGSSGSQNITTNFSPDLVWVKTRNATTDHELYDTVRGAGIRLSSNATLAESNLGANGLTSFNSNGFTVPSTANYGINGSGYTYVAWTWDAGSSTVTNTSGTISSQVRANASAGFSIVSWTGNGTAGATVGHGLGAKPFLRIIKRRDAVSTFGWMTFHESAPSSYFTLNSTNAATPASEAAPTSSVFSLPADANSNASGGTYVAYCFAPVAGYSAFGSYTGNGSTDGPFVYTGFRPRWILYKLVTSTPWNWIIFDTARDLYNINTQYLYANSSQAEAAFGFFDITSNGYKIRSSDVQGNASGQTYIYAAFAETPFQYARAR